MAGDDPKRRTARPATHAVARRGVLGWLLIGAALLTSCGGPGPGPSGAAAPASASDLPAPTAASGNEACDLVPVVDLERVLGETPAPQGLTSGAFNVIPDATYAECLWKAAGGSQVTVRIVRRSEGSVLAEHLDAVWQAFSEFDPVAGLGDEGRVHLEDDLAAYVVGVRGENGVFANYQSATGDAGAKRDAVITLVNDTLASMAS
jgi:hypothetical protein